MGCPLISKDSAGDRETAPSPSALFVCAVLPLYAVDLDDLTWTTTDGQVTITDCDEVATGELVILDTIEDNPVTSIRDLAFSDCTNLTRIAIPALASFNAPPH